MKETSKVIIALILIILFMGWAGNSDWSQEVLQSVPTELYQVIKSDLGGAPSDVAIARQYLDRKDHYDSIASSNGW